jgi:hypothetical protein
MKRSGILIAIVALAATMLASEPAAAYHYGWHRAGWHGAHWRYGWRGAHWRYAWRRGGWPVAGALAGAAATTAAATGALGGYNSPYYGYGYNYPYGNGLAAVATAPVAMAAATSEPLMTGRSVAIGNVQMGNYCTTPAKTCLLINESWVGNGCSCRIPGGRARGSVTQ